MDQETLELFLEMAPLDRPFPGLDDRNVFDNRVSGERMGPIEFNPTLAQMKHYFTLKYGHFLRKLRLIFGDTCGEPDGADKKGEVVPDVLSSQWDQLFTEECKAYLLRSAQIPKDAVTRTWYNETPTCLQWMQLLDELSARVGTEELSRRLGAKFPLNVEAERQYTALLEQVHVGLESGLGCKMAVSSVVAGFRTPHVEGVLERLAGALEDILLDPEADYQCGVRVVASMISEEYGIRICDFLEVAYRDASERLEVLASSHDAEIAEVRRGDYSYEEAAGISGSVFLLERDAAFRWIGTEDISLDPRAGPKHRGDYEHVYGNVSSFWVFPVFGGTRLEGALRLIDIVPDGYTASEADDEATWPYVVRAEVAHIADWLGGVLGVLRVALGGSREESVVNSMARARHSSQVVDWIPLRYMSALLTQLTRLALTRIEHRSIGCMVAVGTKESAREFIRANKDYAAIPRERRIGRLDGASELFGRVLSGAGVFVCVLPDSDDGEWTEVTYSAVVATEKLLPEMVVKTFSALPNLCFIVLDGERDMLRIYEHGKAVADYFLNEKTGTWELRVFQLIVDLVGAISSDDLPLAVVQETLQKAIEFSYEGSGGLVVLSNGGVDKSTVSEAGFPVDNGIDMDSRLFANVVSVDGGTWIDTSTGRVKQAGILFRNDLDEEDEHHGGARHKAARFLWKKLENSLVLAVSANREITAYGSADDEPVVF